MKRNTESLIDATVIDFAFGRQSYYVLFRQLYIEALGFTRPLTEISARNIKIIMFLSSKVRPVRRADILTAISEPIF
jgi:hypothetical protein